jgi:UDPglucose--hexose-1-phosphate uridylyltransferase
VIIAGSRAGRPGGGLVAPPPDRIVPEDDPFAEGHEDRTPPELYALRPEGGPANGPGWTVRVVPNLYPALINARDELAAEPLQPDDSRAAQFSEAGSRAGGWREGRPNRETDLFWSAPSRGAHEVIVNSARAVNSLSELEPEEVMTAVDVWRGRMRVHSEAACLHLIVNERREAGASRPHTHAQLYALPFVPAEIARERERANAYATRTMGGNLAGDLLQEEVRKRERIVAIDSEAVVMCPFASRVPFQLMLLPRAPRARFEDDGPTGAALLHDVLGRLARRLGATPPLNLWIRTAPQGAEHFCWRIDVLPRLTHLAGLELGAGVHLNSVAPEDAADQLRDA